MSLNDAKRNILVCEFVLAFSLEPGRCQGHRIQNLLIEAKNQGFQGLELLAEALQKAGIGSAAMVAPPTKEKAVEAPKNPSGPLKCTLCPKVFEKGIYGWRGYQNKCKDSRCSSKNLESI